MKRKAMALMLSGIMAFTLAGCADNPKSSVVREKNMEKMLEEAGKTDAADSYGQVKEEVKKYETYRTKIKDKNLKVKVTVDAKVEIPEVEKLSVYRVSAQKISQEFLDRIRKTLTPDVAYYDGAKKGTRTKQVIAEEIQDCEKWLAEEKRAGDSAMVKERKDQIAGLRKEYEKAPDSIKITDYPSDLKIQSIKKLHESSPGDTFYDWLYELHGNGKVFYGISDGKDGNHHALYMQNSGNYGNCLRYECSKNGLFSNICHADVENDVGGITQKKNGGQPDFSDAIEKEKGEEQSVKCADNEPLTLSQEQAEAKADTLLEELGLDDYKCYEKGVYSQMLEQGDGSGILYRDVYRFLALRQLDGVFVNNQAGFKLTDGWQGSEYVKKMWGSEAIAITVNDNGIVGFYYLSPLSIDEIVVEDSRIKPFRAIRDTFEQMVVIENAPDALEDMGDGNVTINVADVNLVYTRVSEKDSFDTGLVVPVWDFEGTVVDEYGQEKTGNILSINAIDGSVINQRLGY